VTAPSLTGCCKQLLASEIRTAPNYTPAVISIDGKQYKTLDFDATSELETVAPEVYKRVRDLGDSDGTVIFGDVDLAHPDDWEASTFERLYEPLGEVGSWLIIEGNLNLALNLYLDDGNLDVPGVSNYCGRLHVLGKTHIPGALHFDSNDGGFTSLTLAEPVGFIATSANQFEVKLRAQYFFDALQKGPFDAAPQTRHDEIIQEAFVEYPRVITREHLAAFFKQKVQADDAVAEILAGRLEYNWITRAITSFDARAFATFFDTLDIPPPPARTPR
jgi:hypothetical protein